MPHPECCAHCRGGRKWYHSIKVSTAVGRTNTDAIVAHCGAVYFFGVKNDLSDSLLIAEIRKAQEELITCAILLGRSMTPINAMHILAVGDRRCSCRIV